jgi:mannose-1-phosphate guanylyltransferase
MIETDVFPRMAKEDVLFSFALQGYWADIGQPKDFLRGMKLHLASLDLQQEDPDLTPRSRLALPGQLDPSIGTEVQIISSTVLIDPSVRIGRNSVIGPNVTIGPNVEIGEGVRISDSSIFEGTVISNFSHVSDSIIGWRNRVGKWTKVENFTVTGENVTIQNELFVNGAIVLPHKSIKERIIQEGTILM